MLYDRDRKRREGRRDANGIRVVSAWCSSLEGPLPRGGVARTGGCSRREVETMFGAEGRDPLVPWYSK